MKRILLGSVFGFYSLMSVAQAEVTINLQRFFGACEAEYGKSTDVSKAVGECGIITTLVNKFQQDNPDIKVNVTTVEWPGYDQLNAQLASRSAPDVVSMHYSIIPDYQSRGLIEPIDELLTSSGVDLTTFTEVAKSGVTKEEAVYGLPFDTWTMLLHVNMNLMKEAGLVNPDGTPILPKTVDELFVQGAQFKEKTGKPYFVQITANESAAYARLFYTWLQQQNSDFFANTSEVKLNTPAGVAALSLMKRIYTEGLSTKDMDYAASVAAFSQGAGGIAVNGTWLIGTFDEQAKKAGNSLSGGYRVYPVSQLFPEKDATYADGHAWVLPKKDRSDEQSAAIGKLFKFLADNETEWARTGHLPAIQSIVDSETFAAMPHRSDIEKIATTGQTLPPQVQRQFAIQDILAEELNAAIVGNKPIEEALAESENRINDLLADL